MTTPVTPIRPSALNDMQNALQLCVVYGDKDIADSDAKQALGRVRGLIAQVMGKLGEPNSAAVAAAKPFMFSRLDSPTREKDMERDALDCAAVVLRAAITGEVYDAEGWINSLPCPDCDGAAIIQGFPCEACKGTGLSQ